MTTLQTLQPHTPSITTRSVFGRMVTDKEFPEYKNKLLKTLYVEGKPIHEGLPKQTQNLVIDPKLCTTHEYLKNPRSKFFIWPYL